MSLLDKFGITQSKGFKRLLSFALLFLSVKFPALFSSPEVIQWLAGAGYLVGQAHAMVEK